MSDKLLFANPSAQTAAHRAAIDAAIKSVLDGQVYIHGPVHERFEKEFARYIGVKRAVAVGNGTDAIVLALKAYGIGDGDEVLCPSHTATASTSAIRQAGAQPVFVDVDARTYVSSVAQLEAGLGPKVRAILGVHLYGCPIDAPAVRTLCDAKNLIFIEDCSQATGARWKKGRVGSFGHIATFSFFPTKNLGAIGDGGAVTTDSAELADRFVRLRTYGWTPERVAVEDGFNSRLDELQAAILLAKLTALDADNERRRAIAAQYRVGLAELPVNLPGVPGDAEHVYHLFVIATDKRDALKDHLAKDSIIAGVHYPIANHQQPAFSCARKTSLTETEKLVSRILSLPIYPELRDEDVDRVCSSVRKFFGK